jgi:hypothetical protein
LLEFFANERIVVVTASLVGLQVQIEADDRISGGLERSQPIDERT